MKKKCSALSPIGHRLHRHSTTPSFYLVYFHIGFNKTNRQYNIIQLCYALNSADFFFRFFFVVAKFSHGEHGRQKKPMMIYNIKISLYFVNRDSCFVFRHLDVRIRLVYFYPLFIQVTRHKTGLVALWSQYADKTICF